MTDYQKELLKKIQSEGDEFNNKRWAPKSLYESVMMYYHTGAKDVDIDALYPGLKRNGYRVTSEEEAITYVCKVGHRHKDKFKELYSRDQNKEIFESDITLVIWGCGVGLDLFAFHDAAMIQERPDLWVHVRHILLIDIEPWALNRAAESAEMLFPTAKIETRVVDLTDENLSVELAKIELGDLHLIPRVHLVSNVLDLLVNTGALRSFFDAFKSFATQSKRKVNEYVLMFSPAYGEMLRNKEKVDPCVSALFGDDCDLTIGVTPPEDLRTVYFSYRIVDQYWTRLGGYQAVFKKQLFRNLRAVILDQLEASKLSKESKNEWARFWLWATKNKLDLYYDAVRVVTLGADGKNGEPTHTKKVLLFAPRRSTFGKNYRPLLYCSKSVVMKQDGEKEDYYGVVEDVIRACGGVQDDEIVRKSVVLKSLFVFQEEIDKVYWVRWHKEEKIQSCVETTLFDPKNLVETSYNFKSLFFLQPAGETLPPLPALDRVQREIALTRKKLRKVHGSAGAGKTVAMLWHGILAYKRTHLPVLFLGKTNSLLSANSHKFASQFVENSLSRDAVEFMTVNNFICKVLGRGPCGRLSKTERKLPQEEYEKVVKQRHEKYCPPCNECAITRALEGEYDSSKLKKYSAVLLDEAQIAEPEMVKAIYRVTEDANPFREFYIFCDEQQTLHKQRGQLERDDEDAHGKFVVRVPDKGFGRFKTLKMVHRFRNKKLLNLASWIQRTYLAENYDILSLVYEPKSESDSDNSLFQMRPIRVVTHPLRIPELVKEMVGLGSLGKDSKNAMVIMFDTEAQCRDFTKRAEEVVLQELPKDWKVFSTHGTRERVARQKFREMDKILHVSTIDSIQGHTFSKVLFVITRDLAPEELFTACTRARDMLYILDLTKDSSYYHQLKQFN